MEPWSCLRLFSWCGFIGSVNNFDMTKLNWSNVSSEEAAILITNTNKAVEKDNIYECPYNVKHFPLNELQGHHYKKKSHFEQLVINELGTDVPGYWKFIQTNMLNETIRTLTLFCLTTFQGTFSVIAES